MPFDPSDPEAVRDLSWIGDALLSLFSREWIMENETRLASARAELFRDMTSNQFLSALGVPSVVEARIGDAYRTGGLAGAREYFDANLVPLFLKQQAKRQRAQHC